MKIFEMVLLHAIELNLNRIALLKQWHNAAFEFQPLLIKPEVFLRLKIENNLHFTNNFVP